jgi:putative peptidoglycan lipid II flippase
VRAIRTATTTQPSATSEHAMIRARCERVIDRVDRASRRMPRAARCPDTIAPAPNAMTSQSTRAHANATASAPPASAAREASTTSRAVILDEVATRVPRTRVAFRPATARRDETRTRHVARRLGRSRNTARGRRVIAQVTRAPDNRAMPDATATPPPRRFGGAVAVGAGILLSRIAGLVRDRAIAHYLGLSAAADAFRAALRIPNLLQNLLGEGVLSASFIPVYARLVATGKMEDASRVARAIGTLLALVASAVALVGVLAARPLVDVLAPGFDESARELTIALVRVLFPGVALLVMSAWCLGVLNSHRRFFLSYASPVLWNTALIAAAVVAGRRLAGHDDDIATWLAWGAVIGSAAQLLVQLPTVIALLGSARPSLAVRDDGVRQTLRAFGPVVLGRGSVQLSGYIDQVIASLLGRGMVAAMQNAQTLALLPISLFGMAISAAELPEMSSATGDDAARAAHVRARLGPALRRVVFLVVPSAVAFVAIGGAIVAVLFQSGRFDATDTRVVWIVLAGSAIGLSAGAQGRLLNSAFYALNDTKSPLRAALARVAITGAAGYAFALPLRDVFGYGAEWGAFALTASAGVAAWIEFALLRRWLVAKLGAVDIPVRLGLGALAAAAAAGALGYGAGWLADQLGARAWLAGLFAIAVYGAAYLGAMIAARVPEARAFVRRGVSSKR